MDLMINWTVANIVVVVAPVDAEPQTVANAEPTTTAVRETPSSPNSSAQYPTGDENRGLAVHVC
jgi:hypothetical protein